MPIELPEREPCPFCENLEGRVTADTDIKQWAFIERLDAVAAFVNPFQMRRGAVLVVTTRHAGTILDLTEPEVEALARLVRRVAHALHDAFDPIGLNIFQNNGVASSQSIPHYHVHIVPRHPGDSASEAYWKDSVLIEFDERARLAQKIARHLPK